MTAALAVVSALAPLQGAAAAEDWLTESVPEAAVPPSPTRTPEPVPSAAPSETTPPFLLTPDDWLSETLSRLG